MYLVLPQQGRYRVWIPGCYPRMENQTEQKMHNDIDTGILCFVGASVLGSF